MPDAAQHEWFDQPRRGEKAPGLRFACTMCGNCCTGPEGYVLVSDAEAEALARRLGISVDEFLDRYTRPSAAGRSLTERQTEHGLDCVFLDRQTILGKAVCGVYEDRPAQCRTWPFWRSNLASEHAWRRATRVCPGMNTGKLTPPQQIRIRRAEVDI
jgi:Fe-S-cluster containining protein